MASGGSHPTSDARLGDFALSRRQNSDKRLRREPLPSDLFFLIRSKSTSPSVNGTAKLARSSMYELVPECGPPAAASVFSGKDPHTKKKNERKKEGEKDDPSAPVPI